MNTRADSRPASEDARNDPRWPAVAGRDASADGSFVYAVRSTGVYCRPGCPSRTPKPENVVFFDSPARAAQAGYRPCKRCRPGAARSPEQDRLALVRAACRSIEQAEAPPSLAGLALQAGLSLWHFQRLFKEVVGLSPRDYARACKASRLRRELAAGRDVASAVYEAGYGSSSRVYEDPGLLGMTPAAYRRGGPGERIGHALARTSLGWLLVAATARGLCLTEFGEDPEALRALPAARFPRAELVPEDPGAARLLAEVVARIETGAPHADLPLDVRGTAFQQRVWRELARVAPGHTVTYSELAVRAGNPSAVRAAASACAANPAAVAVPCHRAVGKDGKLHGYRWGLPRKRALLEREAGAAKTTRPPEDEP